jgi:predicted membrane channel-forming protein YqfA (hemolysin III family)
MATKRPHYKKAPLWILLWIVSGVILVPFFKPIFIVYNVITILFRTYVTKVYLKGTLTYYFKRMSISEDQTANVYGFDMLNDFMLKKNSPMYYGFVDETISSATGKAKLRDRLNKRGILVDKGLEAAEKNHSIISIEDDEGIAID